MGIMSKILGSENGQSASEYVELDMNDVSGAAESAGMSVRIAEISDKHDVIDIKDAIYDGDLVLADITRHSTSDRTIEHIIDELRQVTREVDGDIVQKGDDQLIVTPTGIGIDREKL
ncbi:cell division protein SepF [Halonotius roseus]|uniref:DUF552 domain-containing protein n=1 Tax=Halonotius roseus TaxID=2511997 RepID=A0A544QLE7_9EURY|nr:cell division protein SepF [Halonotius roseus]TQQ79419.1 DUF552 domain-containing protein [Halonotius roseus]